MGCQRKVFNLRQIKKSSNYGLKATMQINHVSIYHPVWGYQEQEITPDRTSQVTHSPGFHPELRYVGICSFWLLHSHPPTPLCSPTLPPCTSGASHTAGGETHGVAKRLLFILKNLTITMKIAGQSLPYEVKEVGVERGSECSEKQKLLGLWFNIVVPDSYSL